MNLNCYGVGRLVGLNRYCVQVPFYSPEFELDTRFASSKLTLKYRKGKFYISQVNCCGGSVAREQ